ncbi:polysaccharide deacetylase family protein [Flavobacterium sp.]|uniref:polysaccharide deacetylase family protein n=1 Tax=Flavobacterium sp. TaxID=239 RepID=UPI003D130E70
MILLSFDIEEFDMPFEYGKEISFEEQIAFSVEGTHKILDILDKNKVKATFFSTATFALNAKELIDRIVESGHEIASHNYYHTAFSIEDLKNSKEALESLTGTDVIGFRMPRMYPVDEKEIQKAGYTYNSSINPTYLPGRYNNLDKPRTYFYQEGVLQIPASVSPWVRFPLFWLSFHNLPLWLYKFLANWTYKKDNYLNIYFHPWEFMNINQPEKFNFPAYVVRNCDQAYVDRLDQLIQFFKTKKYPFGTFKEFVAKIK